MALPEKMTALVARGLHDYALEEVPVPKISAEDILLKVEACGICAGDVKATHGTARFWGGNGMPGYCEPPFIPGHEFIGEIVAMGERVSDEFKMGDRIATEQIVPCGKCRYCRAGKYWLCDPHNVYGFKYYLNGGMAEYVLLPKGSINYVIPNSLPIEKAVLIEPFSCSTHAVRLSQASADDIVVLAGAGTLGLGMVGNLRKRNPKKLIVLDLMDGRLDLAKRFGADITINPGKENAVERVLALTEGCGCDIYIEATGNPDAVVQGLNMICKGGTFVEFSVFNGPSTVDWSIIGDTKEIVVKGSQLSPFCYPAAIEGIVDGTLPTDGVVTHRFPLSQWAEALKMAESGKGIKVILVP